MKGPLDEMSRGCNAREARYNRVGFGGTKTAGRIRSAPDPSTSAPRPSARRSGRRRDCAWSQRAALGPLDRSPGHHPRRATDGRRGRDLFGEARREHAIVHGLRRGHLPTASWRTSCTSRGTTLATTSSCSSSASPSHGSPVGSMSPG